MSYIYDIINLKVNDLISNMKKICLLVQCLVPKFCELFREKNIEICDFLRFYPA
jgi:hypothetical protein